MTHQSNNMITSYRVIEDDDRVLLYRLIVTHVRTT
jgi:hypothetical protein